MTDLATAGHGVTALGPLHEALARARRWRAMGISILLGAFSALAFAPFHVTAALIVSLTGLVWMIDGARGLKRWGRAVFARGWAFGFGFFLVSLHWTASPFLVEPEKHAVFLWLPLIVLPGGMALIWGAVMTMAGAFWSSSPSRIFIFALFFGLGEWIRGALFGGFPWNLAGTTFLPGGALSQAASLGGVYWLTLITIFACASPAALVDTREKRGLSGRLLPAVVSVVLIAGLWAWGAQKLQAPTEFTEHQLVLMDVGVPQSEKYVPHPRDASFTTANPAVFRRYLQWLTDGTGEAGDIILWPEGATGSNLLEARQLEPTAAYLGERSLIAGTTRRAAGSNDWFNALAILSQESAVTGAAGLYDKHRLVPVGELPIAEIIPFGQAISGILPGAMQQMATNGFKPGVGPAVVYGDGVPPFVAMICYEALYPNVAYDAQQTAGHRADWIVVVSNDGWFGAVVGPAQHYAQNRYRAIESGLPMARVASRGVSAIVDGYGRETQRTALAQDNPDGWAGQTLRGPLPSPVVSPLFQSRTGQMLFPLTLVLFSLLAFMAWRR
ncbi:MAG: apolipoprotein N-acyltransferase [Pseudomonadota bacterium]